ncbi:MAG: hypoxanthine phosphoribosyltransferase [Firmicutes bacterium]|mgnify:CR=1 FL=1|jgi:hypoxanthine phosphoribosyltransferase|nr:hypoxanthine phosphoribosyltransferase [Bacillota bacterium]
MPAAKTRILLTREEITQKVEELAGQVFKDYQHKTPVLICILKGAVVFLSDFMRYLQLPVQIDFMAVSSYGQSTTTTGVVRILKDLEMSIENRDVIIIEDIIDTGLTLSYLRENLLSRNPRSLKILALLDKPDRRKVKVEPDYCGFSIPDEFVVGYGLDFNEKYRNLPDLCILLEFGS